MKLKAYATIAALGVATALYAEEVQFSDTPKAVQKTVNRNLNGGVVKSIDKDVRNGRTVYNVGIRREGTDKQIKVDADGTVMASNDTSPSVNITTDKNDGKYLGVLPTPSHDDKKVKGEANVGDHKVKVEGHVDPDDHKIVDYDKNRNLSAESHVDVGSDNAKVTVDTDSGKHKIIHKGDGKLLGFIPWKKNQKQVEVEMNADTDKSVGAPASSSRGISHDPNYRDQ